MPTYSNNYQIYKWDKIDTKLTTITEISSNADKIDTALKNHADHLTANDGKIGDLASLKVTDKSSLVNAFNEQGGRLDNIITNAGNSNPEIVDARGTFSALKDRLNNVDLEKANKTPTSAVVTTNINSLNLTAGRG